MLKKKRLLQGWLEWEEGIALCKASLVYAPALATEFDVCVASPLRRHQQKPMLMNAKNRICATTSTPQTHVRWRPPLPSGICSRPQETGTITAVPISATDSDGGSR